MNLMGRISRKLLIIPVIASLLGAAFVASPVFAHGGSPTIYDQTVSLKHANQVAAYFHRVSAKWLPVQDNWLAQTATVVTSLETLQKKRASGSDMESNSTGDTDPGTDVDVVSYIGNVETTYKGLVAETRVPISDANHLVATHPGFDANGNVTDLATAGTTVTTLMADLDNGLPLLRQAWEEVHNNFPDLPIPAKPVTAND
jgi:hypothetical protein